VTEISGRYRDVYAQDVVLRGGWLQNIDIDAAIENVVINGVDVVPLIEAELNRRDPERHLIDPPDADGFRAGWAMVSRRWDDSVARARTLPEELLHERVDEEWSYVETLRHLVFATECWALRVVEGDRAPYSRVGLPFTEWEVPAELRLDVDLRLGLDEVLAVRADRQAAVSRIVDGLTDADLTRTTEPVTGPGWPESGTFEVRGALQTILNEEYLHRQFAERDLAVLTGRT
jgi:hypothetical protein